MNKKNYRVRNWKDYNEALVKRGSVTLWIGKEVIENWQAKKSSRRGRPQLYNDSAIICALTLKALFNLTFRSAEGFIRSLVESQQLTIKVPDYTLICKRQKHLKVDLPKKALRAGEKIHLLVDSTGLKVFGEGEWKVRQHGFVKHRLWRKLHLGINGETQEIEAFELTDLGVQDSEGFEMLLEQIERPLDSTTGDGSYDRFSCYEEAERKGFKLITPPQKNAKTSKERPRNKKKASDEALKKRDEVIEEVRNKGRKEWKKAIGYHRRSLAETAMYRIKTLLGNRLKTKTLAYQRTEVGIWCRIINKMTALGMPETVAI